MATGNDHDQLIGRMIDRRINEETRLTLNAIEAETRELGNPVPATRISQIRRGCFKNVSDKKIEALCQVLGGTRESFLEAAKLDMRQREELSAALIECTTSDAQAIRAVEDAWRSSTDDIGAVDACAERLMEDMRRGPGEAGCRCQALVDALAEAADADGLERLRRFVGLLFSAGARCVPILDGKSPIDISDARTGWALQVGIDGNQWRPAAVLLDWYADDTAYPTPIDPLYSVQMPRLDEVLHDPEDAGIEAVNRALGGIAAEKMPASGDANYTSTKKKIVQTVNGAVGGRRNGPKHVFVYNTQACSAHLDALKTSLSNLRVFDLHTSSGTPLLHCSEVDLERFLKMCFQSIEARARKVEIAEQARREERRSERRFMEINFKSGVSAVYITESGLQTILETRKLSDHDSPNPSDDTEEP